MLFATFLNHLNVDSIPLSTRGLSKGRKLFIPLNIWLSRGFRCDYDYHIITWILACQGRVPRVILLRFKRTGELAPFGHHLSMKLEVCSHFQVISVSPIATPARPSLPSKTSQRNALLSLFKRSDYKYTMQTMWGREWERTWDGYTAERMLVELAWQLQRACLPSVNLQWRSSTAIKATSLCVCSSAAHRRRTTDNSRDAGRELKKWVPNWSRHVACAYCTRIWKIYFHFHLNLMNST